ncbi:MAG: class I SAM-dependent methyltransferase [Gaiellaceae bacterium]
MGAVASFGRRILEIGPGTGQATRALVERGCEVVAVELGANLAAVARRNVPEAQIVTADFETWEPERAEFDVVAAFTAFHWIDRSLRYAKPARLLHAGGTLAIAEVEHVLVEGGDPFWVEVQEDYDAVVPSPDNRPPPYEHEVGDRRAEFAQSELFRDIDVHRYRWDVAYGADEWTDVLRTYSPNIAADPATTGRLLERIHRRIGERTVTKHYLATLTSGRTIVAPRGA